ncbi:AAA family ATPase [Bacillus thuringiensis]|uniref:AAA family ATPase n=1 Tax=Bacillus thuringiensis TaxID=1428 RepID=UPI000B41CC10|nr:AAA family ATPase [Bacillus thuringiensis]ARX69638.1 ATPase [Bacillus thuringiensis]MDA2423006.1 AAA family ATPase [Bacillus cereus]MEB9694093.1 AAA family ATPase [Bacillus cereus]
MGNKYKNDFLDLASKLDALVGEYGEITKYAIAVVDNQDKMATITLLKKITDVVDLKTHIPEVKLLAKALKDSLIKYYGYITVLDICNKELIVEDNRTLPELLSDLNELIGLSNVKTKVDDLIAYQKVQQLRKIKGLPSTKNTLHLAFMGKPGTGKTTVARIVGRIYKQLGLLSKGHFIEVSRTDLIAGYQGQTALKVKKVIEKAKGGVLFIDEAYSITENDQSDSYGRECLTELTKALEDYREDLVVIVAGYTEPMNKFFDSNSGLKSRFNIFIEFEDYTADELEKILMMMCNSDEYVLNEEAKKKIRTVLKELVETKDESFANGRLVRNIYDELIMNHAKRVVNNPNPSREDLSIIIDNDFMEL